MPRSPESSLIALTVKLVFDDIAEAKELKFATKLDIPKFKPFAAALGTEIEEDVGRVKFDGAITGSASKSPWTGTTLIGQTTIKGTLAGSLSQGQARACRRHLNSPPAPRRSCSSCPRSTRVYQANADEQDEDVFDYEKVWETLFVDLQIKVAKIEGGGSGASNIQGRVTYLAGVVGLDPLTLPISAAGRRRTARSTRPAPRTIRAQGQRQQPADRLGAEQLQSSYPVSGALNQLRSTGAGNSKAQIPKSLDGNLTISLRNGWIGTSLLDLAGMTLPAWLLTRAPGGNQATLVCTVAPFNFKRGRGGRRAASCSRPKNVQVAGVGFIDFRES